MRNSKPFSYAALAVFACVAPPAVSGAAQPVLATTSVTGSEIPTGDNNEFVLKKAETDKAAPPATASKIKATKTHAAMKFTVLDKDTGPIKGVVISLTDADGKKFYTEETNDAGYAEVLVPNGKKYDLVFLTMGRKDIAASVNVDSTPNQNNKLTLRHKRYSAPPLTAKNAKNDVPRFVLTDINFDSGKSTVRPDAKPQLDSVVEFLTHKPKLRIEISGHTDSVGNPTNNKALSLKRAQACRDYIVSKGIDAKRIEAVGYGDERPIAPNDTDEGRQKNRRIEATEL
jgi:outer membrane protein OmpA-like peptidoglycan-associated protein